MATFGNRPALYKPTDFSSQQKRLAHAQSLGNSSSSSSLSSSEIKRDEEKVTFKIQQRPTAVGSMDQKPPTTNTAAIPVAITTETKTVTILTDETIDSDAKCDTKKMTIADDVIKDIKKVTIVENLHEMNKDVENAIEIDIENDVKQEKIVDDRLDDLKKAEVVEDEKQPDGVAQKDLDRIAKLKEFMARQQQASEEKSSAPKPAVPVSHPPFSLPDSDKFVVSAAAIKSKLLNAKLNEPPKTKIVTSTAMKLFTATKSLSVPKVVNGDKSTPGILTGVVPSKTALLATPNNKAKENKWGKDVGKKKGNLNTGANNGGRSAGGAGNKISKTPISIASNGSTAIVGKPSQNDKTIAKNGKVKEVNNVRGGKQVGKPAPNANNAGARSKVLPGKSPVGNQRTPNEQHKNQHGGGQPYNRAAQMHGVNSFYSHANKTAPGFPGTEIPPWLPYAMNTMNMNGGAQSILGQPQGPLVDFNTKQTHHHEKNSDKSKNVVNGPASGAKKVVTVEASKDKSEQKKSLDFVKSFFDTDPEVQYNRKVNAEKRNAAAAANSTAPTVSTTATTTVLPTTSVAASPVVTKEETVTKVSRAPHVSNNSSNNTNNITSSQINNMNSHYNSHGDIGISSNHMSNHFGNHGGDINSQFSSMSDHIASAGHVNSVNVNNYGGTLSTHTNATRLLNNSINNNQVNSQSFVHSASPHMAAGNHIAAAPGSHIPGAHIPASMASTYNSVYHHTNVSNMQQHNAAAAAALHPNPHPNPQSGHFQGSSTVSPVHMGAATATQLHPSALNSPHQQSQLHHRQHQQTYDLYSQVNQMNPLAMTEPDRFIKYCSVMNNYPGY